MEKNIKNIAIMGATGNIAKSLIAQFSQYNDHVLYLFARDTNKVHEFLSALNMNIKVFFIKEFIEFENFTYDVVINCVGIGNPRKVIEDRMTLFSITESIDNLILEHLKRNQKCLYINMSSGAVYGNDFDQPAFESKKNELNVNNFRSSDIYAIVKLNSEAKHRAFNNCNIVDLRIYGFFSRFNNLEASYLINELILCIKNSKHFITNTDNVIRDYIHPKDLKQMIDKCIFKGPMNDVFDVYSKKPITKFELLDYFEKEYGLKYEIDNNVNFLNATGKKNNYFSTYRRAENIGYCPTFESMETIIEESRSILER